jgi:hypothetical protein
LRDAVDLATRAIIAAGESDDALADAAEDLDGRAFAALRQFFTVLKCSLATKRCIAHVRVVTLTSRTSSRQRYILRRLAPEPAQ